MNQFFRIVTALALGAGAMYYLDPQQGRRRRALVGDKVDSISHDARDYLDSQRKHASDRVRGMAARVRSRFSSSQPSDQQLYGNIRARLGRTVSYPHAVETDVRDGWVILKGDILEGELNTLMAEIWGIRGVKSIDCQLALHGEPGSVPSLQGRPRRTRRARMRYLARNGATLLAIIGGGAAILRALRREGSATGMVSLAAIAMALGMGDSAQRLARRRRGRISTRQVRAEEAHAIGAPVMHERPEEVPALLNPPTAFH